MFTNHYTDRQPKKSAKLTRDLPANLVLNFFSLCLRCLKKCFYVQSSPSQVRFFIFFILKDHEKNKSLTRLICVWLNSNCNQIQCRSFFFYIQHSAT